MKNFVVLGLICAVTGCGDSTQSRKDVSSSKAGSLGITSCNVDGTSCTTCDTVQCTTCDAAGTSCVRCDTAGLNCTPFINDPSQSKDGKVIYTTTTPIVTAGPYGAYPASYTFLDTPDANLCADAFLRKGITLPDTTVARSVNSINVRNNGIAWQDMGASTIPVLNVLHLDSHYSNVLFQFMNPVGFYCIVKNQATFSNVQLQRKCSAQIAEIEPMTTVTINPPQAQPQGFWGRLCGSWGRRGNEQDATTSSLYSSINEVPCIP